MNSKGNPVLIEMAGQLPEASKLYQLIMTSVNYATIFIQAKEDFFGFADLDKEIKNGMTGLALLKQNGYESYLQDMEDEDRLRMCGIIQMLADLAQELDED
ncbi:hypothetical protein OAT11_06985 [Nitrospinaceae bacterium]|jgi:hypothetical protein|nr:hypothetical protein [Nitrospinaceae bacterium]HCG72195.1 hypothetical protein [Nitrospina sp.]